MKIVSTELKNKLLEKIIQKEFGYIAPWEKLLVRRTNQNRGRPHTQMTERAK